MHIQYSNTFSLWRYGPNFLFPASLRQSPGAPRPAPLPVPHPVETWPAGARPLAPDAGKQFRNQRWGHQNRNSCDFSGSITDAGSLFAEGALTRTFCLDFYLFDLATQRKTAWTHGHLKSHQKRKNFWFKRHHQIKGDLESRYMLTDCWRM